MASRAMGLTAPVQGVMTSRVVMVLEEVPMAEVRAIASRYDYNGFPVVSREGRLVGMVTKGDLLRVLKSGLGDPDVWLQPVSRWMAHGVLALRPRDSLETAVSLMVDSGLRSLPVIDDDGKVVGIVSRNDLMGAVEGGIGP
ncbi:MAG: CBS domain-containing protein [Candidatus Rokubacteria bacterium]|nr:CBS domain-containing protein [Candidatus Rokubacteria bacterium]